MRYFPCVYVSLTHCLSAPVYFGKRSLIRFSWYQSQVLRLNYGQSGFHDIIFERGFDLCFSIFYTKRILFMPVTWDELYLHCSKNIIFTPWYWVHEESISFCCTSLFLFWYSWFQFFFQCDLYFFLDSHIHPDSFYPILTLGTVYHTRTTTEIKACAEA